MGKTFFDLVFFVTLTEQLLTKIKKVLTTLSILTLRTEKERERVNVKAREEGKKNGIITIVTIPFFLVTSSGFKPETSTAVMWCSIQLSYEAFCEGKDTYLFLSCASNFKNY